jgi:hypothetical protein
MARRDTLSTHPQARFLLCRLLFSPAICVRFASAPSPLVSRAALINGLALLVIVKNSCDGVSRRNGQDPFCRSRVHEIEDAHFFEIRSQV